LFDLGYEEFSKPEYKVSNSVFLILSDLKSTNSVDKELNNVSLKNDVVKY